MKATLFQEKFLKGLTITSRFVSSRAQLPVLSNILISAKKQGVILAATNLETGISLQIGAKVEKEGETTVPARLVLELLSLLPPGKIQLQEEGGQLKISANNFSASLATLPANDFPKIPVSAPAGSASLPREVLDKLSSQVGFAAATDESRPNLTGILLLAQKDKIQAVATDGFRLSIKEFSPQKKSGLDGRLLVPAAAVDELVRALSDEEEVKVAALEKEGQVIFAGDSVVLTGRLLEGEFPDFAKILPDQAPSGTWHKTTVDKNEFMQIVKAAAVFAREGANVVRVQLGEGRVEVSAESQQYGREEAAIDAKTEGGELEAAFNYRYLLEFLDSIGGDEVTFSIEGPTSPGLFQDPKDPTYRHLIMPVRIQA